MISEIVDLLSSKDMLLVSYKKNTYLIIFHSKYMVLFTYTFTVQILFSRLRVITLQDAIEKSLILL